MADGGQPPRQRRKRKRRGDAGPSGGAEATAGSSGGAAAGLTGSPMARGYARAEQRNREAREALEPLHEGERPPVVTVGAAIAGLVALSIVVGYLAGAKVDGETPELPQVAAPALLMGVMSWGMWRARYWAVLGFQVLLVFLIFSAFFGLALQASTLPQFAATLALLAVAGALFYFMVKAMARIQMPERRPGR